MGKDRFVANFFNPYKEIDDSLNIILWVRRGYVLTFRKS
jgi:hypothetical protein